MITIIHKTLSQKHAFAVLRTIRIILLFPLAFLRLNLIFIISLLSVIFGMIWLSLFGFSRKLQSTVMQIWGQSVLFICGIKVNKNKVPRESNFIIMPNHRSYIDIFIVAAYTPAAFVSKAELMKWPLLKTGAKLTNLIFVSRADLKSLISAMCKIKSSVENKIPVAVFPEGTTSRGPLTCHFKNGSFKIAADAGIPVIPMAIHYTDDRDSWVDNDTFIGHFLQQMSKPVTKALICYGEPVINNNYKTLQKVIREEIDKMLIKLINKRES